MAKKTVSAKGPGKGAAKKSPAPRESDTISPYYATMKYGNPLEKSTAKKSMSDYFSGKSGANKRGETEAQHIARNSKKDTIPSARKARGFYQGSAFGGALPKKRGR